MVTQVEPSDTATTLVLTGYEVFRFGVPIIGQYANAGTGRKVIYGPTAPGSRYRFVAWALDSGTRRSVTPAVKYTTSEGLSEF